MESHFWWSFLVFVHENANFWIKRQKNTFSKIWKIQVECSLLVVFQVFDRINADFWVSRIKTQNSKFNVKRTLSRILKIQVRWKLFYRFLITLTQTFKFHVGTFNEVPFLFMKTQISEFNVKKLFWRNFKESGRK